MSVIDVVVVGAGPVGLLTAIELTLGGARVLVLERLAAPSMGIKAMSVGPLGVEALQRRGMATVLSSEEARNLINLKQAGSSIAGRSSKVSGHFAGLFLIRKDAQTDAERRMRFVDQQGLEAVLADRAHVLGIEVRRGCDVTDFVQQEHGIDLRWTSAAGEDQVRCAYLVGCDGGRSAIRKMAGFNFPGTPPTLTMYQAIVELDHPEHLLPAGWHRTAGGVFSYGAFPGRLFMLDFSGPPENRQAPVTHDEIETVLRRTSLQDVRVTSLGPANRWTDNTRLVDTYRHGRVLLAGDAAHVHAPFGGQGLSLGLVDAANLGWKLAAVVRGEMPENLLDSYTTERRPVAEAVLANTRAQVAIMRPDPQSGAMRDIMANLMQFDDVNRFIGEITSGLSVRYDLGSEQDEVGRLLGDTAISHGEVVASLYEILQDGRGVLLDGSAKRGASAFVACTTQRVSCVTVDRGRSMLIRPDACVAWVGQGDSLDGLEEALRRWFTPPRAPGRL
ncbi:FAD-dependent monooxygenase [Lichenihabitans sp. PAMC28606]|uniref:FAD-dependent monooxygenase n=1 Tax=Lichenihabitans sp. PAMC28606 TaxID=2880932 RepID=UPI001D0A9807|nr:FAD-dependent monooxygenase [Lichenihabitans sp. PAMC28606]UDL95808.1 FAD-dependent monooxygenase [Lichenihabitans sp. PAMC28606]